MLLNKEGVITYCSWLMASFQTKRTSDFYLRKIKLSTLEVNFYKMDLEVVYRKDNLRNLIPKIIGIVFGL